VAALRDKQVTVIGLGLMGGSLAGALTGNRACRDVIGVARRPETVALALEHGWVDRASSYLAEGVAEADVVVLATPVRTTIELLPQVGQLAKPGCVVMDLGSTKAAVVQAMATLPNRLQPVGGHPMCGKETSGLEAAEPDLYQGRVFVLTPLDRTEQASLSLARELVEAIGARPMLLAAERHDRLVAAVSHLPYLMACGLVGAAEELAQSDDSVWQLAASGFRDSSRLAASEVSMMLDILLTNRAAVSDTLGTAVAQLGDLARLVKDGDEDGLRMALEAVHLRRCALFS
jgi:prephenate dehydrogenase